MVNITSTNAIATWCHGKNYDGSTRCLNLKNLEPHRTASAQAAINNWVTTELFSTTQSTHAKENNSRRAWISFLAEMELGIISIHKYTPCKLCVFFLLVYMYCLLSGPICFMLAHLNCPKEQPGLGGANNFGAGDKSTPVPYAIQKRSNNYEYKH